MMFQLEEERKVTANLSRTLELEKRKVTISFAIIGKYMRDGWMIIGRDEVEDDRGKKLR